MEDFSAPSFSLGIDLDPDPDPDPEITDLTTEREEEAAEADDRKESFREPLIQELDDDQELETLNETQVEDAPPRILKRLRRGPQYLPSAAATASSDDSTHCRIPESDPLENLNDDIEEFSSPEKENRRSTDDYSSTQTRRTGSCTKFSLMHHGILSNNSEGKQGSSMAPPASNGPSILTTLEASNDNKKVFPRLTISPIRKINLVDSDSDESSPNRDECKKKIEFNPSSNKHQTASFWEDFSPNKKNRFATPALDDFCYEYFSSFKNQNMNRQTGESKVLGNDGSISEFEDLLHHRKNITGKSPATQPPAYRYFCHADPSIRTLIRRRFPHFVPVGLENDNETRYLGGGSIDYMGQFNSIKRKNGRKCSSDIEAVDVAGTWVTPGTKSPLPKDAGKRRVSAVGHQSGYWFTNQDGRKVYVNKTGQELSGQIAYTQYKKETGGYKKSKKKAVEVKKKKAAEVKKKKKKG